MSTRHAVWPPGTPSWVDYGAADLDAAKDFYGRLLGWTYEGGGPEYGGYLTCSRDGHAVAGMLPRMDPASPVRWSVYFAADDADAMTSGVERAGGTVVMPAMDVGAMGRMALGVDPHGVFFGIWQGGLNTGFERYAEPGAVVWVEASVPDPAAAQQFYGAVLGYTFEQVPELGDYATFSLGGEPLGGISRAEQAPIGWGVCFGVESLDDAVALAGAAGATERMAAQDTGYGRIAALQDPFGAPFALLEAAW